MRVRLVALLIGIQAMAAMAQTPADRWNLADLYPSLAAWDLDAAKVEAQMKEFSRCKGHLADSAARLRLCLELQADMTKRYLRMVVYSSQLLAEDTGAAASLELVQKGRVIGTRLNEAGSFVNPEVLRMGKQKVAKFIGQDAGLKVYRQPLDQILRLAPHTLDAEGEALIARFGLMNDTGGSAYNILTNADIPWPTIRLSTGEDVRLDAAAYTKYREVTNRDDRKRVMDTFFGTFKTYERTIGITLYSQLKQDTVYSKVRRYPDSISRALDRNRVPVAVFDTLIRQTNASLPTLHRYFRLRAKMLGVDQLHYYDIYPPLVQSDIKFALADAEKMVIEAVAPLGPSYASAMEAGFNARWMDAYPRLNKQSGAHMAGFAYDVHPYVLMNYNADYESVTTLAHEWGHAMHSYLSNRAQPFVTAGYAIFVAEIASTFNEQLLLERMLKNAQTDDERLLYLGSALEQMRATFFRQAMFAEFERNIHERVDKGDSLTGSSLTKTYCDVLKRYHGAAEGVVAIDDAYCVEWAYIAHFYNSFYVYQYATSIAASALLAQKVSRGEPGALERYQKLLRAGGSDYPYELVKAAGVDLATPAPYQALVAEMNAIMDQIEAILAKRR
jgi:oligoendopeptidase F